MTVPRTTQTVSLALVALIAASALRAQLREGAYAFPESAPFAFDDDGLPVDIARR